MKLSYSLIQKLAVFYVAIWSISPPLMIGTVYRLLALGCVALWFVLAILRGLPLKKMHCAAVLFTLAVAAIAYILYMWIKKDIVSIYEAMPAEQITPMIVTTVAVSLLKVAAIAGVILLIKWSIGKVKTAKDEHSDLK